MRGLHIILFGLLGLVLFGCIGNAPVEENDTEITTGPQEGCTGCAVPGEVSGGEEPVMPGSDRDEHGCIASAGYTWCEVKQKCLRAWEEPCVEGSITHEEARSIALNSSCVEEGTITNTYVYNNNTRTWWFDMNITRAGCAPACVVSEIEGTAEINWRCTGLIIPENETAEQNETAMQNESAAVNETQAAANVTNATAAVCTGIGESEYSIYKQDEVQLRSMVYRDECTLAKVVKDYYCKDGKVVDISHECPPGYDCRDGACKPMEYTCTKTYGNDTTIKGRITVSKGLNLILDEYDECIDEGSIKEWMCAANGSGYYEELYCGSGMRCQEGEGRCVRSTCRETDNGDDPEHFGKLTFTDRPDEYRDVCISDRTLREYYCYGETFESKTYACANNVCDNDECRPASG
ncbi:hypothetical protein H0O02_02950 [Candidatus Micrarchaeota archaeon]|nr:hypothetical protein [Candidatus Micrarchaeota archaeon]